MQCIHLAGRSNNPDLHTFDTCWCWYRSGCLLDNSHTLECRRLQSQTHNRFHCTRTHFRIQYTLWSRIKNMGSSSSVCNGSCYPADSNCNPPCRLYKHPPGILRIPARISCNLNPSSKIRGCRKGTHSHSWDHKHHCIPLSISRNFHHV